MPPHGLVTLAPAAALEPGRSTGALVVAPLADRRGRRQQPQPLVLLLPAGLPEAGGACEGCEMPGAGVFGDYRRGPVTSIVVTVVVTLVVALHLAAIIDVALMPDWAWRGAADAPKWRWIVLLCLVPGWAIVYYRSADRREVRAHLFRCGGIEPEWHAEHAPEERSHSLIGGAVATAKDRRLVRDVIEPRPGTNLVPIHWHAGPVAGLHRPIAPPKEPRALERGGPVPRELLPPIHWRAADHERRALPGPDELAEPRALPAPRHLRLTA